MTHEFCRSQSFILTTYVCSVYLIHFLAISNEFNGPFNSCAGHPWVQVGGVAPDKPLDSAVLSRLKQFSAMNKLKKIAIRVSNSSSHTWSSISLRSSGL